MSRNRKSLKNENAQQSLSLFDARKGMLSGLLARLREKNGPDAGADVESMLNGKDSGKFTFTQTTSDAFDHLGVDPAQVFDPARNPKGAKRLVQLVNAMVAGNYARIDTTSAVILYALTLTDSALTTDALHYLAAGLKEGKVSPETRGVNRSNLTRLFGRVGLGTVATQASRTVGKNGYLTLTGAVKGEPGKVNQSVTLDRNHPLVREFVQMMNDATATQIDAIGTEGARAQ